VNLRALGVLAMALTVFAPGRATARGDRTIVPGLLGYNGLPAIPNADPVIEPRVLLELGLATQLSDLGSARDAAITPYVRLVVPFHEIAALEVDGVPVEWWRVSAETQQRLSAVNTHGIELGDLRFGARFHLLSEGEWSPALGVRFVTKTTTGKGFENRRFADSPAYAVNALLGKDLLVRPDSSLRLRLLVKLGFLAWQQGSDWQDDAVDAGATLQLRSGATRLDLEWRGYWGYEQMDKPHLVGLTIGHGAGSVEWVATVNRGLTDDAPPWELRASVIFRFDSPWRTPVSATPETPVPEIDPSPSIPESPLPGGEG
jgi:hypothetical protein